MPDLTCIYYTSNKEKPDFEARIRQTLIENMGDTPLISVSQQPIDFGNNICVGEVGASNHNAFRQLQIGAREAKTPFVCSAESDFIYPPDYFNRIPVENNEFYMAYTVYMVYDCQYFRFRRYNEGAMIVGRDYLVDSIEEMLDGNGMWSSERALPSLFKDKNTRTIKLKNPIVTFKTDHNMHQKGRRDYTKLEEVASIPYWGKAEELVKRYYEG